MAAGPLRLSLQLYGHEIAEREFSIAESKDVADKVHTGGLLAAERRDGGKGGRRFGIAKGAGPEHQRAPADGLGSWSDAELRRANPGKVLP